MLIAAIENLVLFSTVFAIGGLATAFGIRLLVAKEIWRPRAEITALIYSSTIVAPPLAALWLVSAAFVPRLWLSPEKFEAIHPGPSYELHLLGELTVGLEPTLSYGLVLFVIVSSVFAVWSNVGGSWRIAKVIKRLDLNAVSPPWEQVALVNDIATQRGLAVGLVMTDYPLSFVWGFRRSKLILSSGLLRTLTATELAGVLEHEAEHHTRRDNLFKLILSLFTYTSLIFPLTRVILKWRANEVEAVCDEAAAARTSAPLELAEALVKLRRKTISDQGAAEPVAPTAIFSGFLSGSSHMFEYRVGRLLGLVDSPVSENPTNHHSSKAPAFFLVVSLVALIGIWIFAPLSVHHAAETLIETLR